jgi:hypothetical protein
MTVRADKKIPQRLVACRTAFVRRLWSSRSYRLRPASAVAVGCVTLAALVGLAALAARPKPKLFSSDYDPNCGIFPAQDRVLAARIASKVTTDIAFLGALSESEQLVSTDAQRSAQRIRLQCGWLRDRSELSESASLQYTTWGIDLAGGAGGALFVATRAAASSGLPLSTFQTNGRFDVAESLKWALSLPPTDPLLGPDFQPSRDVIASVIDTIRDHRQAYVASSGRPG